MFAAIPFRDDTLIRRPPIVTVGLIAACVAVFLWQAGLPERAAERFAYAYGMVPAVLFGEKTLPPAIHAAPAWLTPVTLMFLHGSWMHLIGNMIYLWLFGRGVESALGSLRFAVFYAACGVAAALVQAATDPGGTVPMIGASGAIAGVLGAYLLLFPRANVDLFVWIIFIVRIVRLPAVILLGLWFLLQLASALSAAPDEPGVAFWAHVGGFGAGMVLLGLFRPRQTTMFQPRQSTPFAVTRMGPVRRGSVPPAGSWRRGPWA